jgi:hypothetical protein
MNGKHIACVWVAASLGSGAIAQACTSHIPEYAVVDGGLEGGGDAAPPVEAAKPMDAVQEPDATPDAITVPQTRIRFAMWSPDAPNVDFCVAPIAPAPDAAPADGGSVASDASEVWQGPLIGQEATLVDGGIEVIFDGETLSGLAFPQVSAYFDFPAGSYAVRLVLAGSADCSMPLLGNDATNLAPFKAGASSTVAVVGEYSQAATDPSIEVVSFADDTSGSGGSIRLRLIAAIPSATSLDLAVGTLGSPGFHQLFTGVLFGQAATGSDAGPVDSNGYLTTSAFDDVTLSALKDALDAGALVVAAATIPNGSVATIAAVGGKTGGVPPLPELALCLDTAPPVDTVFANCTVLSSPGD